MVTGLELIGARSVTIASNLAMKIAYEHSEYACTRGRASRHSAARSARDTFDQICAALGDLRGLDLAESVVALLKNTTGARVAAIELFTPGDARHLLVVKAVDPATLLQRNVKRQHEDKMHKDRMISVTCVNFLVFSRSLMDFWVLSYGSLDCSNVSWGRHIDLASAHTVCSSDRFSPDGAIGGALVSVQDYVQDAVSLAEFCVGVRSGAVSSLHLRTILAMVFLNLQIALESCLFMHSDLHVENVMVRDTLEERDYSILYASNVYTFRTRYTPVIIDYDFSTASPPYSMRETVAGWLDERSLMFGNFQPPGLDALVLLGGVKKHMFADPLVQTQLVETALGRSAYSGTDNLLRYLIGGVHAAYDEDALWATFGRCDTINALVLQHPIDFALRLMGRMDSCVLTTASAGAYVPSDRARAPDSAAAFWSRAQTLDAMRGIHRKGRRYTDDLASEITRSMEEATSLADVIGTQDSRVEMPPDMTAWDDYYLLRYLQQDRAHGGDGLFRDNPGADMLEDMATWALGVSTRRHIELFELAFDKVMVQRYTLSDTEVVIV